MLEDIFARGSSTGVVVDTTYVAPSSYQNKMLRLVYFDMGGNPDFQLVRRFVLKKKTPLGILFFLDHRDRDGEKDVDRSQQDDGKLVSARIQQHHNMFKELIHVLVSEEEVRKSCHGIIIIVNKCDLWRKAGLTLDDFVAEFGDDMNELMLAGGVSQIPGLIQCSIYTGEGIPEVIKEIAKLGWEMRVPIVNKVIRSSAPLVE